MMAPKIKFVKLHPAATLPTRTNENDAGIDLYASEDAAILPGETVKVHTGIAMQMPDEWDTALSVGMAHIEDRSSVGSKGLSHTAGVVDFGYNKGEIVVCVTNLNILDALRSISMDPFGNILMDLEPYEIKKGDKFAQIVLQPVYKGVPVEAQLEELENRDRGAKGFGSSGGGNANSINSKFN